MCPDVENKKFQTYQAQFLKSQVQYATWEEAGGYVTRHVMF